MSKPISCFIILMSSVLSEGLCQKLLNLNDLELGQEEDIEFNRFLSTKEDTIDFEIKLIFDFQQNPQIYYTELTTPVCETGVCKLVSIKVFWDLTGSYLGYELPEDKILTKLDHKPFDFEDYEKLHDILANKHWSLADYEIDELIVDSTKTLIDKEIDAYTGATAQFVDPDENIEGALYTIYTLWKFIHDPGKSAFMQQYTTGLLNQQQLSLLQFLQSTSENYHVWAIEKLKESRPIDEIYLKPLLKIILGSDQFVSYEALQLINSSDSGIQKSLWDIYENVDLAKKRDIVRKLSENQLDNAVINRMILYLASLKSYPEARILLKFIEHQKPLSLDLQETIKMIDSYKNEKIKQEVYALLQPEE